MKCIIVDDEPIARLGIKNLIATDPELKLIGECQNISMLEQFISNHAFDLIFLDIEMPGTNGIEFLKKSKIDTNVILTTAYENYALESYNYNVIDYLLKPISTERFHQAITKAKEIITHRQSSKKSNFFYLKCDKELQKILFDDILYIEAMHNYVKIITTQKRFIHHGTLKKILSQLPDNSFIQVHKSFVISKKQIQIYSNDTIQIGSYKIPIGRNYKSEIKNLF
jgi:DNA-binding LytR/AlgR family response regulator